MALRGHSLQVTAHSPETPVHASVYLMLTLKTGKPNCGVKPAADVFGWPSELEDS